MANLSNRTMGFDVVRGIGIVTFIFYHVFYNYTEWNFYSNSLLWRSTFFITGYFVFASNFFIGYNYNTKLVDIEGAKRKLIRSMIRSLKLIGISILSSVVLLGATNRSISLSDVASIFHKIVTLSYLDRWDISLQVLIVIGGSNVISALILFVSFKKPNIHIFSLVVLSTITIIDCFQPFNLPYFWRFTMIGLWGFQISLLKSTVLFSKFFYKQLYAGGMISLFIALIYLVVNTNINLFEFIRHKILLNIIISLCFTIGLASFFQFIIMRFKKLALFFHPFAKNGEYSLFVYLLQIIIINLAEVLKGQILLYSIRSVITQSILIFILCYIVSLALDRLRQWMWAEKLYLVIFK